MLVIVICILLRHFRESGVERKMSRPEPPLLPLRRRLLHWGPIGAMSIVACICISSVYCHLQWWPPARSFAGLLDLIVFLMWNYLCLTNLLRASYVGPGFVPFGWRPENSDDEKYLQPCEHCDSFKAPRAHHCRQCGRCVMKMDHHCPWINNCCGHRNQGYFIAFLISAVIGCIHATLILGPSLYWAVFRVWYIYYGTGKEPRVELGLYGMLVALMAFGLAFGVIIAVGFLFLVQLRSVIRNRTGIEDYIVSKATSRRRDDPFVYPYDLGWKKNLKQVFTWDLAPISDGIVWPVKEGCHQYALTVEQIELKRIKRMLAIECEAAQAYSGTFCSACRHGGCGAFCTQPCFTGEKRLPLRPNDRFLVTRATRHWMYGEKLCSLQEQQQQRQHENGGVGDQDGGGIGGKKTQRGWFPRRCMVEIGDDDDEVDDHRSAEPVANSSSSSSHREKVE